jgi:hypothetical protein
VAEWKRAKDCSDSACVEVKDVGEAMFVRDSKEPHRRPLRFTKAEWQTFLQAAKAGEFDG